MGTIIGEGITFDDVLLVPQYSEVTPNMIELQTHLTKKIVLNIPMMSAAMDTVTESKMAIAMARQGGIGIIHKNMSIEAQADEVDKVKRSENGVITDPFYLSPDHTLQDADNLMAKFKISGVPITKDGKLVGIITNRDLKFETDFTKKISESMTSENLITAPEGITLDEAKKILAKARKEKLPIVDKDYNLKGLITIKDIEKQIKYPLSAKDDQGRLLCGAGVGITGNMMERVDALVKSHVDVIVVDSAHGHSKNILEAVKKIKAAYPDLQIIAGNIATGAAAKALIEAGADAVKVEAGVKKVAFVKCAGTCDKANTDYDYTGVEDCVAMSFVPGGGPKSCNYGCLGYGSCVKACPFDSIHVVDGVACVNPLTCKACGKCVEACPKHLIELIPYDTKHVVKCSSKDKGKDVMKACSVGCIGCHLCEKNCPSDAVHVVDNVAYIDQEKCTGCGICAEKCPKKIIL